MKKLELKYNTSDKIEDIIELAVNMAKQHCVIIYFTYNTLLFEIDRSMTSAQVLGNYLSGIPVKVFTRFPVKICASDFEDAETSHGGGTKFTPGTILKASEYYVFDIEGELVQGYVTEDYRIPHIPSALNRDGVTSNPIVDIRHAKIILVKIPNFSMKRIIRITYYLHEDNTRTVVEIFCKK